MRKSTDLVSPTALEGVVPPDISTCSDMPIVISGRESAGNDATYERSTSYELYRAARAHRSRLVGDIFVAMIRAVVAIARRAHARHRQRRQARAIDNALRQLDDRTLRDLGFDRSEITSIAAEVTGEARRTRVRALRTSYGFSR
jgi:uncharacterized protein YjiS (DUF1127 family)